MKQVDIYITAGIRAPARGNGRVMYIMLTKRSNGTIYESLPSVAEFDEATENRLVLAALWDALQRLNYACAVTVYTESIYIGRAINSRWPEKWEKDGWKNAKGKEVKDSILWCRIQHLLEETGSVLSAETGPHEYSGWMRWHMPLADAYKDIFGEVRERRVCLVHD